MPDTAIMIPEREETPARKETAGNPSLGHDGSGRGVTRETFAELVRRMEFLFEVSEDSENEAEQQYALEELSTILTVDLPRKVDAIAWFDSHCESEARHCEQVIEKLQAAVLRHEARKKRVRDLCRQAMQTAGIRRVQGTWASLSLRAGSKSVEIVDEGSLPREYWKQNPPPAPFPDKLKLRKALDAGEEIPGARISTGPEQLVVK